MMKEQQRRIQVLLESKDQDNEMVHKQQMLERKEN